jgi:hypothetical protein
LIYGGLLGIRAFGYMGFSVKGLFGIRAFGYTGFSVVTPFFGITILDCFVLFWKTWDYFGIISNFSNPIKYTGFIAR